MERQGLLEQKPLWVEPWPVGRGQRTGPGRAADVATVDSFLFLDYLLPPDYLGGGAGLHSTETRGMKGVNLFKRVWGKEA